MAKRKMALPDRHAGGKNATRQLNPAAVAAAAASSSASVAA